MALAARLQPGESLGDRIIKVNHAGEHGAISIYITQRWIARWRAPKMVAELDHFLSHERRHRALFGDLLAERGRARCRSYHLCGMGGALLGLVTGLLGSQAIAATTVAIERVVLAHLEMQLDALRGTDPAAVAAIADIIAEEREHHDSSAARLAAGSALTRAIDRVVEASTEAVIWLGMRL